MRGRYGADLDQSIDRGENAVDKGKLQTWLKTIKESMIESSKGKDPKVGSKSGKSTPAKDPVEEPIDKVIMDEQPTEDITISDEGHVLDPEDTNNAHMPKIPDTTT
ncbi:hypothetical protein Tco_1245574 [Tanacetum coccineum]